VREVMTARPEVFAVSIDTSIEIQKALAGEATLAGSGIRR